MSEAPSEHTGSNVSNPEVTSALFAQLVMQQANMAMMLMGKIAHPESGQVVKDLEAARFFIDQLEMIEIKTKGNLSKEESGLLKQSLMSLRLSFVQAVEQPESKASEPAPSPAAKPETGGATAPGGESAPSAGSQAEEEHRTKFSKKY
jgi:hypothetical protein